MLDHISLEDRSLARTDCTLAPSPVNYTGPCCHLNVHGNFSDHGKVEAQGRLLWKSFCLSDVMLTAWAMEWCTEWTDWQAKGTNWHQAREKSPWDRTNRNAMTRDYITTCSGQNEKSSLLAVWILPATGDNDIKYKLVFKLFKSGNCTWFACPTEELYVSKFWAVSFFLLLLLLLFEH